MEEEIIGNLDGEIYLDPKTAPQPSSNSDWSTTGAPDDTENYFEDDYFIDAGQDTQTAGRTIYERVIAKWKDPTSLPHSRKKCAKWCYAGPLKTCCGWKLQYRWIYNTATVRVTTSTPQNIEKAVNDCMKTAAVVAAITAIFGGGASAIAAAEKAFEACLFKKFGDELLSVAIKIKPRRGSWE
jgi:hypothetical protein